MRFASFFGAACVVVGLTGCKQPKGVDIEPMQLVPKDATMVAGFSLDPVRKSLIGDALTPAMRADADIAAMATAISECEVNTSDFHGVLATQLDADDRFMAVVQSPGIGEESVVRCMEKEISKATGGESGIILFETRGDVRITPQEGGGYLIMLNKNTIAVVDKPWEDVVFAAIESADARNTDSPIAKLVSTVSADTDVWLAMELGDEERAGLSDVPGGSGLQAVLITGDLDDGLALQGVFDLSGDEDGGAFREGLAPLLKDAAPAFADVGITAATMDAAKIGGEGARVELSMSIGPDAFPKFVESISALMAE